MNLLIPFAIFFGMAVAATILSVIMSTVQCNKQDIYISAYEGFRWATLPTVVLLALQYSPWLMSEFTTGISFFVGKIGLSTDDQSLRTMALSYAMMLAALVVTSSMLNNTDVEVCKPSVDELKAFQDELMAKLKKKEADKKRDEEVIKPDS